MEINRFKNHCLIKDVCTEELLLCSPFFYLPFFFGRGGGGTAVVFYLLIYFFLFIFLISFQNYLGFIILNSCKIYLFQVPVLYCYIVLMN